MFTRICIWVSTRNWKRFAGRAAITYAFMLAGVLGADLTTMDRLPSPPLMIGYTLVLASYLATGVIWSQ